MEITLTSKQYPQLKAYLEGNGKGMQAYVKSCTKGKCDANIKEFVPQISAEVNLFVNPDSNPFSYCDFYWTYILTNKLFLSNLNHFVKIYTLIKYNRPHVIERHKMIVKFQFLKIQAKNS